MVFEKLSDDIGENQYYNKHKYDESEKKISMHLRISPDIANDLVKIIAVYRGFGIDKHELIKSELAELIFKEYIENLNDDESGILGLFSELKAFRDGGVANE